LKITRRVSTRSGEAQARSPEPPAPPRSPPHRGHAARRPVRSREGAARSRLCEATSAKPSGAIVALAEARAGSGRSHGSPRGAARRRDRCATRCASSPASRARGKERVASALVDGHLPEAARRRGRSARGKARQGRSSLTTVNRARAAPERGQQGRPSAARSEAATRRTKVNQIRTARPFSSTSSRVDRRAVALHHGAKDIAASSTSRCLARRAPCP